MNRLEEAAARAQERGEGRRGIEPRWVAQFVMLTRWGAWYLVSEGYVGARAIPVMVLATLLHGIAP